MRKEGKVFKFAAVEELYDHLDYICMVGDLINASGADESNLTRFDSRCAHAYGPDGKRLSGFSIVTETLPDGEEVKNIHFKCEDRI